VQELLTYFSAENNTQKVRAIPGEGLGIPVWILGSSTDSAYLAAAMGLPYAFASHFAPNYLLEALHIYKQNFKSSAYLSAPHTMAAVNVIAADSNAEAEYLSTSFRQLFAGVIRGISKPLALPVDNLSAFVNDAEMAAIQQMLTYSFNGDQATVRTKLNNFLAETAADELIIVSHIYDQDAKRRSYELIRNA
jgi:luciferase family oxidoreductase group 1